MNLKVIMSALVGLGLAGTIQQTALAAPKEKPSAEVEAKITAVLKAAYPDVVIIEMICFLVLQSSWR